MNKKAQAGLEYLVTYGWAFVFIAAVIGVLIFVISTPQEIVFSSSDPMKLIVKGGSITDNQVEVKLQNITGGRIRVVSVSLGEGFTSVDAKMNDRTFTQIATDPEKIGPGGELHFTNIQYTEGGKGYIEIGYQDYANLGRTTYVSIKGTVSVPSELIDCASSEEEECNQHPGQCQWNAATCIGESGCENYASSETNCLESMGNCGNFGNCPDASNLEECRECGRCIDQTGLGTTCDMQSNSQTQCLNLEFCEGPGNCFLENNMLDCDTSPGCFWLQCDWEYPEEDPDLTYTSVCNWTQGSCLEK